METDILNPMLFDVSGNKKRYEYGEHLMKDVTVEEVKKWKTVYTTYFDATLSIKEGRRVGVDKCAENINVHILGFACDKINVKYVVEPLKKHPRDYWGNGRVKI